METLLGFIIGIGLSAACGFRVFVPLLGMSIAVMTGQIHVGPGFAWLGTWPALIALIAATVVETGTYYIPWLDNAVDTLTTPAAIVAGTIITASMVGDLSPFLKWSLAAIAGGGASGIIQLGTVAMRGTSSAATGGFGNFLVATVELIGAILTTILAIFLPLVCIIAVFWIVYKMVKRILGLPYFCKAAPK